jgi:PAS domain S-box-containing protein
MAPATINGLLPLSAVEAMRSNSAACDPLRRRFMAKVNYSEPPDPIAELVKINPVSSILIDIKTLSVAVINEATLKLLGYSQDEMVGEPITKFVPMEDIVAIQKSADEPPPEGETRWRCVTKEGKVLFIEIKYRETMYQGRVARFVVLIKSSPTPFD